MKIVYFGVFIILTLWGITGCATWQGIKKDSKQAWSTTKKTIHDATAD